MIKIGITGGIGSGKTTVSKVFELLGVPVFYSDYAAKQVMVRDNLLVDQIKGFFGHAAYLPTGELNRKHLASIVFGDETKLAVLNSMVHPAVFRAFDIWAGQQTSHYVVKEAAILFESGSYLDCDATIHVAAPEDLRIERVLMRDKTSEEEIRLRIAKQMPETEKMKLAHHVLYNDEKTLLIPQILRLHHIFTNIHK